MFFALGLSLFSLRSRLLGYVECLPFSTPSRCVYNLASAFSATAFARARFSVAFPLLAVIISQ